MRLTEAWREARERLEARGIPEAYLEAEVLLRHTLGKSRAQLYAALDTSLSPSHQSALDRLVERRSEGEPAAYILGKREFYGLALYVDRRVLIPRPETELLGEAALGLAHHYPPERELLLADIGTGCGAIAIALAVNLPRARVVATDISPQALEVARLNCQRHGVADRVELVQGDLMEPLPHLVDIIVANLPYVAQGDLMELANEVRKYEPALALSGGGDGMEVLQRFFPQLPGKLSPDGAWAVEVGLGQVEKVREMARAVFPQATIELLYDLGGIPRVVVGSLQYKPA